MNKRKAIVTLSTTNIYMASTHASEQVVWVPSLFWSYVDFLQKNKIVG
jgi:hypothetical protein